MPTFAWYQSFSNMQAFLSFEVICFSSAMPGLTFLQLSFMALKQNFYQLLLTRLFTSMDDNFFFYSLINNENVELLLVYKWSSMHSTFPDGPLRVSYN